MEKVVEESKENPEIKAIKAKIEKEGNTFENRFELAEVFKKNEMI